MLKGTVLGTPNGKPQEYSRNIMEYEDPGRSIPIYSCYILGFPVWGSQLNPVNAWGVFLPSTVSPEACCRSPKDLPIL